MSDSVYRRILAKVTRAKQHIHDFELAMNEFIASKPYEIIRHEDANSGKRFYYLGRVNQVPEPLEAIAADAIQNLKDPLDHIAYQLVVRGSSPPTPKDNIYFPITGEPSQYKPLRRAKIKGVRQEIVDAIDATEPYKGGKGHALWRLKELNNPGKHHLLVATGSMLGGVDIARMMNAMMKRAGGPAVDDPPPLFLIPANPLLPLKNGDVLYSEPISTVDHNPRFAFDVAFNVPGIVEPEPALKTLKDTADLVSDIVRSFGRFF